MKFYAEFDGTGAVLGAYSDHDDTLPSGAVEISAAEFGLIQSRGIGSVTRVAGVVVEDAAKEEAERLAVAESEKLAEIRAACDEALAALRKDYPETEVSSWDQQLKEAEGYTADLLSPTPLLSGIASGRGVTVDVVAAKVLTKAEQYKLASGPLFGHRQAIEDQIKTIKADTQKSDGQKAAAIEALNW